MRYYIRQAAEPRSYLNVDIDSSGMSVCWVATTADGRPPHVTWFASEEGAQAMVDRLAERYPTEKVFISHD